MPSPESTESVFQTPYNPSPPARKKQAATTRNQVRLSLLFPATKAQTAAARNKRVAERSRTAAAVNRHLKQGHFDRKEGPPCGFPAANAGVEVFGQGRRCERQAVGRLLVGVHGVRQALISRLRVVDASLLAGR